MIKAKNKSYSQALVKVLAIAGYLILVMYLCFEVFIMGKQ